jgi:NitT/TauT family transport system substrate-binding protein
MTPSRAAAQFTIFAVMLCIGLGAVVVAPSASEAVPVKLEFTVPTPLGITTVPVYWIGKALGYNAKEGIDVDVHSTLGNAAEGPQLVAAGRADVTITALEGLLVPASQHRDTGLVFVYDFYQRPVFRLLVAAKSAIKSVAELKGKKIGIITPGAPQEPLLQSFVADAGLTPRDVTILVVGQDAPAAEALRTGRVDALLEPRSTFAVWLASGYDFRELPQPKSFDGLVGSSFAVARSALADPAKRAAIVHFFRTIAEATVFAKANPEAAVKLDFAMYPEVMPKSLSQAEAVNRAVRALVLCMADYTVDMAKLGAFPQGAVARYADLVGLSGKIANVDALWTNELVPEIDDFDHQAIVRQAETYK